MATNALRSEEFTFGVRKCAVGRNLYQTPRCNQSFLSDMDSNQHRSLHRAFRSLLTDRTNVWANLDNMLKNKTLVFSIWRDDVNLLSLFIFFVPMLFVTCEIWQITGGENNACIDCVLWTDDVTIITSSSKKLLHAFVIKFPTKCISWIFHIWKTNRMMLFCNLFIERPSYISVFLTCQSYWTYMFYRVCDVLLSCTQSSHLTSMLINACCCYCSYVHEQ